MAAAVSVLGGSAARMARLARAARVNWRMPIVAPVLAEPILARGLAAVGAVQVGLCACHVDAWPCAFLHLTGLPCPGCGLTRSCVAMLHGDVGEALRYHAMGPLLFVGMVLLLVAGVAPARWRRGMVRATAAVERRMGIVPVLLVVLAIYWPLRLAGIFPLPA